MNSTAKRLIVYAPCDVYPWNELENDLEMMIMNDCEDLTPKKILGDISSAIV